MPRNLSKYCRTFCMPTPWNKWERRRSHDDKQVSWYQRSVGASRIFHYILMGCSIWYKKHVTPALKGRTHMGLEIRPDALIYTLTNHILYIFEFTISLHTFVLDQGDKI